MKPLPSLHHEIDKSVHLMMNSIFVNSSPGTGRGRTPLYNMQIQIEDFMSSWVPMPNDIWAQVPHGVLIPRRRRWYR